MGFFTRNKVKKSPCGGSSLNNTQSSPQPSPDPASNWNQPSRPYSGKVHPQLSQVNLANSPYGGYPQYQQSQQNFQPAGYLPPPPGWTSQPSQQQQHHQQQPVIVNNHYYMAAPPPQPPRPNQHLQPQSSHQALGRFAGSVVDLAKDVIQNPRLCDGTTAYGGGAQSAGSCDIAARFGNLMTLIDAERLCGNEKDLFSYQPEQQAIVSASTPHLPLSTDRGLANKSSSQKPSEKKPKTHSSTNVAVSVVSGNYFSKVELYANSKLPMDLPRLALYIPTWPLLCLAAQYSSRVYSQPTGSERDAHVSSDWRSGTKAMVIKSVPMDHMNTIVFAIRGTSSFSDWAVNLNIEPASPADFLDDPGNLCHSGFLSVARRMVKPVAARLRQMLEEQPKRSNYSLLITGHSAGGAVASLLYMHMLSAEQRTRSELRMLTGRFKRVHCITFGAPPVSLLPLQRPDRPELRKSVFLSIVNEGDPVARADKAYVRSLLELLSAPPPNRTKEPKESKDKKKTSSPSPKKSKSKPNLSSKSSKPSSSSLKPSKPVWQVPPCTLSNAGRIVVLRSGNPRAKPTDRKTVQERLNEGVVAVTCREDQLRPMIWGDPVCHLMALYAGRIEVLAVGAVTAQN